MLRIPSSIRGALIGTWALLALLALLDCSVAAEESPVWLFTSFEEPAKAGLKILASRDGLAWQRVPGVFLHPHVGNERVMRDPSLVRGPDGWFHLVWTTSWRGDNGFGHARSRDLVHWSPQQLVPVMQHEPTVVNVWAPEVFYDAREQHFVICWASTIPGRYPDGQEAPDNNHRMYATTTRDFESFTPTRVFCEPGFSVIDATIVPYHDEYRLVLKDNTRPVRALRVARGPSALGPWSDISDAFTGHLTEGPTVARVGDEWLVYYDSYGDHTYRVAATSDFVSFRDVTAEASFPAGHKHGTVLQVTESELAYLERVGSEQHPGVGTPFANQVSPEVQAQRLAEIDRIAQQGPFTPDWKSLAEFQEPAWYADAKFGIFIHWGVYSVPAFGSEWYPRNMYVAGSPEFEHHVATYGPHAEFGYADFIPQFRAEHFDVHAWAELFRESGAQYVIPVAEHHDGFAMYDSDYTRWKSTNMGPRRDVLGELSSELRSAGIVVGASSHRAENWWYFGPGKLLESDVRDAALTLLYGPAHDKRVAENQSEPPSREFLDDWLLRSCEIVDKYQPQVMYFDWWICQPVFRPYLQRFAAYYYNRGAERGQQVAINFKEWEGYSFPRGTGVLDIERGKVDTIQPFLWQTCTSVSKTSWGYVSNHQYKQAEHIVEDLIDIVSKNGTMLLNIGPQADGTIPSTEQELLRDIGGWLRVNGEAIYGTRPWQRYGEGPTQVKAGSFTDNEPPQYTPRDMRFTTKPGKLFAILLDWPADRMVAITALAGERRTITQITLLGYDTPLSFEQHADGLHITLPQEPTSKFAHALCIEWAGDASPSSN